MTQAKKKQIKQPEDGLLSPRVTQLGSELIVLFSLFLAVYALLSLLTYNAADPGWSHSGGSQEVKNLGGSFGANFSDMLLHGFGYMAFLVPIMILVLGVRFYRDRHNTAEPSYFKRALVVIGFFITVIGGCGLESLHFNHWAANMAFDAGGFLGSGLNNVLVALLGPIGCTLLMVILFLTGITVFSGLSWFSLMDQIGERFFILIERFKERREQKEDREIGEKAREVRREVVTVLEEKVKKVSPTIMPKVVPSVEEQSDRSEREKQTSLFESMLSLIYST